MKPTRLTISLSIILFSLFTGGCASQPTPEPPTPKAAIPIASNTPLPPTEPPPVTETPQPTATTPPTEPGPLTLTSPDFKEGEEMADKNVFKMGGQCNGENYSPNLEWTGTPPGTQSFAITVVDPDGGDWVHWVQFNLPPETTRLPEASGGPELGLKGKNDFGSLGYGGPCPPGGTHRYVFTLYALDTALDLQAGTQFSNLQKAMEGHILAETQLTGLRTR